MTRRNIHDLEYGKFINEETTDAPPIVRTGLSTEDGIPINEANPLHVRETGFVDDNNSTSTLLGASEVFTGTSTDVSAYSSITILIHSDQEGTLMAQFSPDETTWFDGEDYDILAGATKFFTPPVQAKYFRLVYTNGTTQQTEFTLHVMVKPDAVKWSSHNIEDSITDQDDATLTKSVITGKKANGDYDNVSLTNSGNMKISIEEFEDQVSTNGNSQLKTTIYDEGGIPASVDNSTESLQTIDYAHHEIHSGSNYRVQCNNDTIGNGGTLVIGFFVPDQTKLPHMLWDFVHSGSMTLRLYEDVTITTGTGTDFVCRNSRRDAGDNSILQGTATGSLVSGSVTCDPIFTGGTIVSLKKDYSARGEGGGQSRRAEVILKSNTYYAFELSNEETTSQGGQIRLEWYEHTDKN